MLTNLAAFIAVGLLRLRDRAKALGRNKTNFKWIWSSEGWSKPLVGFIYALYVLCSLFLIVTYPMAPTSGTIPGWVVMVIVSSVLGLGVLYYYLLFWAFVSNCGADHQERASPPQTQRYCFSFLRIRHHFSLLRYAGVILKIDKDPGFDIENNKRARRFGTRRHMRFEVS